MFDPIKSKLFQAQKELKEAESAREAKEAELKALKAEIRHKPQLAMEASDHAVCQFMERALHHDVYSLRNQLLSLCDSAADMETQNRSDGMQYVYKDIDGPNNTDLTMIVRNNRIVTCYVNPKSNSGNEWSEDEEMDGDL